MEEIWKDIPGYEGLYQVSDKGNVRSLNYRKQGYCGVLKPKLTKRGYHHVLLYRDGKSKAITVHRLVATTFLPNPTNLPYINHKDENQLNNTVSNLEWCTPSYNTLYSLERHERAYAPRVRGRGVPRAWKYGGVQIEQLSKAGSVIRVWADTTEISRETKWHTWSITQCCLGERKTAYGFKWHFAI